MKKKPVKLAGGVAEDYSACDALQTHVSGLYRPAGLMDCSSHTWRRTAANMLLDKDYGPEMTQQPLAIRIWLCLSRQSLPDSISSVSVFMSAP